MQNSWAFFSSVDGGYPFFFAEESYPSNNYGSERWSGLGSFFDSAVTHSGRIHFHGSLALGGAFASVVQATGGFFLSLSKGMVSEPATSRTKSSCSHDLKCKHCHHSNKRLKKTGMAFGTGQGSVPELQAITTSIVDTLSFILVRVSSITVGNLQNGCKQSPTLPVLALATAFVPALDNSSSKLLPIPIEDNLDMIEEKQKERHTSLQNHCDLESHGEGDVLYLSRRKCGSIRDVVEPRTGIKFPTALIGTEYGSSNSGLISQVLVGIGVRSTTVAKLKAIKIYAFGLYIQPDCVCQTLGQKYYTVPPEELKNRQDFFEDLLRHDIHMTVRLVVHYKGLKLRMVQNAFESALRKRLRKIKEVADDDGLIEFCAYFSKDISLSPGTTIDFHRMPGGQLRTEIGGKELGTIYSSNLCRAFFDMYVGETPVSLKAKEDIGENIGRVIKRC
eukprot:Gb_18677 [translate_table: standard]